MRRLLIFAIVATSGGCGAVNENAVNENEEAKLTAFDASEGGGFGCLVKVSGDVALIASTHGSVYVFRFDGEDWIEEKRIFHLTGDEDGVEDVAVSGDVAVIGIQRDNGQGSARVYRFNGTDWVQEFRLTVPDPPLNKHVLTVSISGEVILIGFQEGTLTSGGWSVADHTVYTRVYRFDGLDWIEQDRLEGIRPIDMSGDVALVAAGSEPYVYRFDGTDWIEEAELLVDGLFRGDGSISGDVVALGSGNVNTGVVSLYRFNGTTWNKEASLTKVDPASDGKSTRGFGISNNRGSVSVSGDLVVVGAQSAGLVTRPKFFGVEIVSPAFGAAYLYRFDGADWVLEAELFGEERDVFGVSVAISGNVVVVGASQSESGPGYASVYRFTD